MSIKLKIKSWKTSEQPLQKGLYFLALLLWRAVVVPVRLLFSPKHRSLLLLKHSKRDDAHQISNYTEYDRYPDLFSAAKELIEGRENLKILSYGCSTGEEVFSLRQYFPEAQLVGVDINKTNIQVATRKNQDNGIIFSHDIEKSLATQGPFDIIFALAVLQRTENRKKTTLRSSNIYPFEKFNAKLTELDNYLKPNGLFIIDHADYRFEDANIFSHYLVSEGSHNTINQRYLFDQENQRISQYVRYHRIFIKKNVYS